MSTPSRLVLLAITLAVCSGAALAHPGWGIVVDNRGNVFYTDLKQVWKVEPAGGKTVAVPHVHTHELYLDATDSLYGEHLWYQAAGERWFHRVWRLAPDGNLTDLVPSTDLTERWKRGDPPDFGFVRDSRGNVYWPAGGDRLVMLAAADAEPRVLAGGGAPGTDGMGAAAGFSRIDRLAVGPQGSVYVLDAGTLRRIASDGAVETVARGLDEHALSVQPLFSLRGPGLLALLSFCLAALLAVALFLLLRERGRRRAAFHLAWAAGVVLAGYFGVLLTLGTGLVLDDRHAVMGLCADPAGNVYVANTGARKLKKVGSGGEVSVFYTAGSGFSPTGCTVANGEVYVLESSLPGARVRKIRADGGIQRVAD